MPKAAAFNMTQSLRALLAGHGVTVHAVVLGPVDTDMNRGFNIPKASPESAVRNIFDGLQQGEEDIFPDPASLSIAEGWRAGVAKTLERQFVTFVPQNAAMRDEVQVYPLRRKLLMPSITSTGGGQNKLKAVPTNSAMTLRIVTKHPFLQDKIGRSHSEQESGLACFGQLFQVHGRPDGVERHENCF